jgi:Gram-negative bacterial TonB protein C-terminal
MKIINKLLLSLIVTLIVSFTVQAQTSEWIRTQSDNGEFSIEIPAKYGFFADKNGFTISDSANNYLLADMNMFNAYYEKTLLSFESYKAGKSALNVLQEKETKNGKSSEIKTADYKMKQYIFETEDSYMVRRYFSSKDHIYILTAASRTGETPAMKRFFDSMKFNPKGKIADSTAKVVLFSALQATPIEMDSASVDTKSGDNKLPMTNSKDDETTKLLILYKPLASYTDAARQKMEQGNVRMRIAFSKDGRISKVQVLQQLEAGLLRQAIFSAIRIKFLPQEKNNEPVTVSKLIEYSFNIY